MSVDIFYFSGTGNSLQVAREIAFNLKGRLVPIPAVINNKEINTDADSIGIVFPLFFDFNGGLPLIIERFAGKLKNIGGKYIFAVCTYGMSRGRAIGNLSDLIKSYGGILSAGFAVNMPYNYTGFDFSLMSADKETQDRMFVMADYKLNGIYDIIRLKQKCEPDTDPERKGFSKFLFEILKGYGKSFFKSKAGPVRKRLSFKEIIPIMDNSFYSDEKCNGCGTCIKICPVSNIKLANGKPEWQHRCEQCFACLHWCPEEAVQFGKNTSAGKRYHHPDVSIKDMLQSNKYD